MAGPSVAPDGTNAPDAQEALTNPTTLLAVDSPVGPAQQSPDGGSDAGADGDDGDHESSGGPVHLLIELLQILFAGAAVGCVVLAGRVYGGEIGRALLISGAGVTLFAFQRIWHNLHELGMLGPPSTIGEQGLFILAAGALALGYFSLYQTMDKRTT
jgi:hypothetical protein